MSFASIISDMYFSVDFDLDVGPVINGVYPHMDFSSSESENMSVRSSFGLMHLF